jgi:ankyrin repeat protein
VAYFHFYYVDYNQLFYPVTTVLFKSGNTPLHVACENGNLDCVGILLQSRSKGGINKGNRDKSTPLHLACQSGRRDVVTFLLENGASINQGDKKETTPLFESCTSNVKWRISTFITLIIINFFIQ